MSVAGSRISTTSRASRGGVTMAGVDTLTKTAAWALGGVAVFSSMHVADELWSRWDIGESMVSSSFGAGAVLAIPTILTLAALTGMLMMRSWGSWLGIVVGAFGLWPPLTHVLDSHGMTAYRWTIEGFAALASIVLVIAAIKILTSLRSDRQS